MNNTNITLSKAYKEIDALMKKTKQNRQAFYDAAETLRNQSIAISSILQSFSDDKGFGNKKCTEIKLGVIQIEYPHESKEYKYLSQSTAEQLTKDLNKYSPETLHVDKLDITYDYRDIPTLKIIVSIV